MSGPYRQFRLASAMISGGGGVGVSVGSSVSVAVGVNVTVGVMVAVLVRVGDCVTVEVGVLVGAAVSVGRSVGGGLVAVGVSVGGMAELHPATTKASKMPRSRAFEALIIQSKISGIMEKAQPIASQSLDRSHIIRGFDSASRHLGQSFRFLVRTRSLANNRIGD